MLQQKELDLTRDIARPLCLQAKGCLSVLNIILFHSICKARLSASKTQKRMAKVMLNIALQYSVIHKQCPIGTLKNPGTLTISMIVHYSHHSIVEQLESKNQQVVHNSFLILCSVFFYIVQCFSNQILFIQIICCLHGFMKSNTCIQVPLVQFYNP